MEKIGVRRVRSALAFWARISYASRFGGSQSAIAVICGGKHRVGAATGRMLGEYPRTDKCWRRLVLPATIASRMCREVR